MDNDNVRREREGENETRGYDKRKEGSGDDQM